MSVGRIIVLSTWHLSKFLVPCCGWLLGATMTPRQGCGSTKTGRTLGMMPWLHGCFQYCQLVCISRLDSIAGGLIAISRQCFHRRCSHTFVALCFLMHYTLTLAFSIPALLGFHHLRAVCVFCVCVCVCALPVRHLRICYCTCACVCLRCKLRSM